MKNSRREFLAGVGGLTALAATQGNSFKSVQQAITSSAPAFPVKRDFAIPEGVTYIRALGVERIQAYRQPMIKKLQEEMPRLGFEQLMPPESTSALLCFGLKGKDSRSVLERLRQWNVDVRIGRNFLRVSPSVFNDMGDINRLLEALS